MWLLGLLLAGCDLNCDRLYMPDLLLVRFAADSWPEGTYEIQLEDQDTFQTLSCTVTLPGDTALCADGLSQTVVDGDALLQTEVWAFAPDELELQVSLDGEVVLWESFAPTYEEAEPNGEGCGVQRLGSIDVVW